VNPVDVDATAADVGRGRFITLEGGDGAGKTTQARRLAMTLASAGIPILRTREPGGAPTAEAVRNLLLSRNDWDAQTQLWLHFAARREHVVKTIVPALNAGLWVVCDRFLDSTFAYQGVAQGSSWGLIADVALSSLEGLRPDLTLVLDVDPNTAMERTRARGALDHYDAKTIDFHERVREGFRAVVRQFPERCVVVDASGAEDAVERKILFEVAACMAGDFGRGLTSSHLLNRALAKAA
jgi:dTMP kinase